MTPFTKSIAKGKEGADGAVVVGNIVFVDEMRHFNDK